MLQERFLFLVITYEDWENMTDKIIWAFETYAERNGFSDEDDEGRIVNARIKEGMQLFIDNFHHFNF